MKKAERCKLNAVAVGLAFGILWGVGLAMTTLFSVYTGYAGEQLNLLIGIYPYYDITPIGALAGLIDGFIDGFFGGWIFALLYNAFTACCCHCCQKK